jgi:hypothetical protein
MWKAFAYSNCFAFIVIVPGFSFSVEFLYWAITFLPALLFLICFCAKDSIFLFDSTWGAVMMPIQMSPFDLVESKVVYGVYFSY